MQNHLHNKFYHLMLAAITITFGWILAPFFGSLFWAFILAMTFTPLHKQLRARLGMREGVSAIVTVLACLIAVILPVFLVVTTLSSEATDLYVLLKSGQIDLRATLEKLLISLPAPLMGLLSYIGLTDVAMVQERLIAFASTGSRLIADRAFGIAGNAFEFVTHFGIMLFVMFFMLKDGLRLNGYIQSFMPLDPSVRDMLVDRFITTIRATVKGNVTVAAVQGILGGLIFWVLGIKGVVLWGALMAILSLLPAVGSSLVWVPAAIYLFFSGQQTSCFVLVAFGVLVIGTVDNLLRPILVGKETQMDDWLILISTIGGISALGINGFVIGPAVAALFLTVWGDGTAQLHPVIAIRAKQNEKRRLKVKKTPLA